MGNDVRKMYGIFLSAGLLSLLCSCSSKHTEIKRFVQEYDKGTRSPIFQEYNYITNLATDNMLSVSELIKDRDLYNGKMVAVAGMIYGNLKIDDEGTLMFKMYTGQIAETVGDREVVDNDVGQIQIISEEKELRPLVIATTDHDPKSLEEIIDKNAQKTIKGFSISIKNIPDAESIEIQYNCETNDSRIVYQSKKPREEKKIDLSRFDFLNVAAKTASKGTEDNWEESCKFLNSSLSIFKHPDHYMLIIGQYQKQPSFDRYETLKNTISPKMILIKKRVDGTRDPTIMACVLGYGKKMIGDVVYSWGKKIEGGRQIVGE